MFTEQGSRYQGQKKIRGQQSAIVLLDRKKINIE